MSQHYSNPNRANDAHALPDVVATQPFDFNGSLQLRADGSVWYVSDCSELSGVRASLEGSK